MNKYKLDDIIVKFTKIKFTSLSLIINKLVRMNMCYITYKDKNNLSTKFAILYLSLYHIHN